MEDNLIEEIISDNIIHAGEVLVAVSGGVDSMYILDVLYRHNYNPQVAHCNFQLRGADSIADEEHVRDYCKKRAIPFHVNRIDLKLWEKNGISTQMAARESRYKWFHKLMGELILSTLVVGTHKDDLTETTLLNLIRGMGHESLTGIARFHNNVYRPLLSFSREDILKAAQDISLEWREDASNASLKYERNRIRHRVLPELREIREGAIPGIVQSTKALKDSFELLQYFFESWKQQHIVEQDNEVQIPCQPLTDFPEPCYVLYLCVKHVGFSFESVCQLYYAEQKGRKISQNGVELWKERDYFLLKQQQTEASVVEIQSENAVYSIQGGKVTITSASVDEFKEDRNSNQVFFDIDQVGFPLTMRPWRDGDRVEPFGMRGSQKVSDLLTNARVPSNKKKFIPVLLSGDDILWVVGHRRGKHAPITANTRRVIILAYEPD